MDTRCHPMEQKLYNTDKPNGSQTTEPHLTLPETQINKGGVPTMGTPNAAHGTELPSVAPKTPVAAEPTMNTPRTSHKLLDNDTPWTYQEHLEPKLKAPRRELPADSNVSKKIRETRQRIQEKKEGLRKLSMAKTYRTKWETQGLRDLTDQWLEVCQTALEDLRDRLKEAYGDAGQKELTLKTLLNNLGINPELVHLNEDEDCFYA